MVASVALTACPQREAALCAQVALKTPQPFEFAKDLLQACEEAVARGMPYKIKPDKRAAWLISLPVSLELLGVGAQPRFFVFLKWSTVLAVVALLVHGVADATGWFDQRELDGFFGAIAILLSLCFVLTRPSEIGFAGWQAEDARAAIARSSLFLQIQMGDLPEIRHLVEYASQRVAQRISALWWATGAVWAVAAFMTQRGWEAKDGTMLGTALLPVLLATLLAGLISSYSHVMERVRGLARTLLAERESQIRSAAVSTRARARRPLRARVR